MGVTGEIFRGLSFNGENSTDYGLYITGTGVYNAPERDVEMIAVPGRNGAYALDRGRFQNLEVTYTCGLFGEDQSEFADAISELRQMLCAPVGYCRLTDDYNPAEYRLAVYKSGLDVSAEQVLAGQFTIAFECKPQRFLTSGDTPVTVASGDALENPTRFDSHPLLAVRGNGTIDMAGQTIKVLDSPVGMLYDTSIEKLAKWGVDYNFGIPRQVALCFFDPSLCEPGDPIYFNWSHFRIWIDPMPAAQGTQMTVTDVATSGCSLIGTMAPSANHSRGYVNVAPDPVAFENGGGTQTAPMQVSFSVSGTVNGSPVTEQFVLDFAIEYNESGTPVIRLLVPEGDTTALCDVTKAWVSVNMQVDMYSTRHNIGQPVYIDTETGEAYCVNGGEIVSANSIVALGRALPVLKPGDNAITHTVTGLEITPRWWRV